MAKLEPFLVLLLYLGMIYGIIRFIVAHFKAKRLRTKMWQTHIQAQFARDNRYLRRIAEGEANKKAENKQLKQAGFMVPKLGNKFTVISAGKYRIAYCFDYYPPGKIKDEDPSCAVNRNLIWDFKMGNYQTAQELVTDFICGHFSRVEIRSMVLCVIPASTVEKNERRYRRFCQAVCRDTGIENGIDYIHIMYDRMNSRQGKVKDTTENLTFSDRVHGKVVLLFDDVYTRGTSFRQCADILIAKGAKEVLGLFLGKTIS